MSDTRLHDDLAALSEAILAIASGRDLDVVLQSIADRARALIDARYAALGVPHRGRPGFAHFLVSGMRPEEIASIERWPEGRGVLAVMLEEGRALRLDDLAQHPRAVGFPAHHPPMKSFLGVPIRDGDEILGDLYLTEKVGARHFSAADEALAELLARHAALAIANARLVGRLAASEQRYRALTDGAPEIVFAVDATGRLTFVNARVTDVLGLAPDRLVGRPLRDLVRRADRAALDGHLAARGADGGSFTIHTRGAAGHRRVLDVRLAPALDDGGGAQGIARDVTERHRLAREIGERTRELATTRHERERLRALVGLIIQAQEDERTRIAGDLHDTTVQTLIAIGRRLRSLAEAPVDAADLSAELAELGDAAMVEADEVRRLSRNLRPSALDHLGLVPALEGLVEGLRRDGVAVDIVVSGDARRLDARLRTTLFRIAQEALTNVRRHSGARRVEVTLDVGTRDVALAVRDDGRGFVATREPGGRGLGLAGMRERAVIVGGALDVASTPGGGTTIRASVPLAL